MTESKHGPGRLIAQIGGGIVIMAAFCAGLFWLAGDVGWAAGWGYLGLLVVGETVRTLLVVQKDPEIMRRRGETGEGTQGWDKAMLGLFGLGYLAVILVGALDARHGWSQGASWMFWAGTALYLFNVVTMTWTMRTNRHFEKTVRIQHDRDHAVVDSGPYRIVRHPGYAITIVGFIFSAPFLLMSWWALVPAAVASLFLVIRTALEDRFLQAGLQGYSAYASRVRYRLFPGLW
jgi:protein-S-isoprenylcysteine O-methyltransferase Ste14